MVEPNMPRKSDSETPALVGNFGKTDPLDRFLRQQRHEGVNDALAVGFVAVDRRTGR